jgi:hypothetical protein
MFLFLNYFQHLTYKSTSTLWLNSQCRNDLLKLNITLLTNRIPSNGRKIVVVMQNHHKNVSIGELNKIYKEDSLSAKIL